jgi:hypothetical protein
MDKSNLTLDQKQSSKWSWPANLGNVCLGYHEMSAILTSTDLQPR